MAYVHTWGPCWLFDSTPAWCHLASRTYCSMAVWGERAKGMQACAPSGFSVRGRRWNWECQCVSRWLGAQEVRGRERDGAYAHTLSQKCGKHTTELTARAITKSCIPRSEAHTDSLEARGTTPWPATADLPGTATVTRSGSDSGATHPALRGSFVGEKSILPPIITHSPRCRSGADGASSKLFSISR